jgi:hypothetical protein
VDSKTLKAKNFPEWSGVGFKNPISKKLGLTENSQICTVMVMPHRLDAIHDLTVSQAKNSIFKQKNKQEHTEK